MALRSKRVIDKLVHCDQTAYVQGRNTGESIRVIDDMLEYVDKINEEGILFTVDIERIDSVDHSFIFATLKKSGFGDSFIKWVKVFLNNSQSCVINNGVSSGYFLLGRGTKQGDPLSPYLFILVLEILFVQIRADENIKGFKIDNIEILLSAFADDRTFIIKDIHSVNRILKHMKVYEVLSSLRVNVDKSEACWIGKAKGRTNKPLKCRWVCLQTDAIKILGIYFSYDKQIANNKNFIKLIIDSRALLNIWNQQWLSLYGNASINSKREHPLPSNPRGFAPIFSPGPEDLYHLNCLGVARGSDLLSKYQVVS